MKRTPIKSRGPNYERTRANNQATKRERQKRRNGVPGRVGIIRLRGAKLEALRRACFERDGYRCQGVRVDRYLFVNGDTLVEEFEEVPCHKAVTWETGEMAHIRTKRNGGDTLENVRTLCSACHHREHNPKVCPRKEHNGDIQ